MRRKELIEEITIQVDTTRNHAERILDAVLEGIREGLVETDEVKIAGFGTFSLRERAERQGRNPQTGEPMTIPARRVVHFKPYAPLVRKVGGDA